MSNRAHIFTTPANFTASSSARHAEREDRKQRLIYHLRKVATLASLEHYETVALAERSRIARLVEPCDEQLRRMCNERRAA